MRANTWQYATLDIDRVLGLDSWRVGRLICYLSYIIGYYGEPNLLLSDCAFLRVIRHAKRNDALGDKANVLNVCRFVDLHARHFRSCKQQIDEPEFTWG